MRREEVLCYLMQCVILRRGAVIFWGQNLNEEVFPPPFFPYQYCRRSPNYYSAAAIPKASTPSNRPPIHSRINYPHRS
jgi:hypothetical protein